MAKILVITSNLKDWTKNSGGKERTATLLEALSNHDVTLLSFSWHNEPINKLLENGIHQIQLGIKLNLYNRRKKLINGIAQPNHDIVFDILRQDLSDFSKKAKELSEQADLVILDHFALAPLIEDIFNVPIVYNSHNSEITMAKQLHPDNHEVVSIVEKMEKIALKKSIAVTYCSEKDFKEIKDHYGSSITGKYIPNGCIIQNKINYKDRYKSIDILFVGSGHPPNVIAANNVIEIAKELPQFNFLIAGGSGHGISKKLIPDNVKILGEVSDDVLHKLFSNSFAFLNPMTKGSGTHLKMMKALSYGIPIISSEMGARGFDKKTIKDSMILGESVKDFSNIILSLKNEKLYKNYCENSFDSSKQYDWEIIKKDYENFLTSFIVNKVPKSLKIKDSKKILINSILRNDAIYIDSYYSKLKDIVKSFKDYDFYLSIYENDSTDETRKKIFNKDFSMFKGISIISENINTKFYGSTKDAERVENLARARNKALSGGNFLNDADYILVIDADIDFKTDNLISLLDFINENNNVDIVSATSIRRNELYDQWATRLGPEYSSEIKQYYEAHKKEKYKKYYSTSNGFCLYRAQPFKEGVRFGHINLVTNKPDCEMVVLCQEFHKKGYHDIYMIHDSKVFHNHN